MDTLGRKIRALRRKHKLTQQALADGIVTPSMISQIESDRAIPSDILLRHISQRLNVPIEYFQMDVLDKSDELQNYRQARQLMDRGAYEEALQLLRSLSFPLSPQFKPDVVFNEIATCCVQTGQLEEAWKMYEGVVRVGYERNDIPTSIHGYYNMGLTLRRLGRDKVARMYWQRAADLLDQNPNMYMPIGLRIAFHLGRLYLAEGHFTRSKEAYEKALHMANQHGGSLDFASAYHGLSCACTELQLFDEALEYNDLAVSANTSAENHKGALRCRINRGVILRQAERYEEAQSYFINLRSDISKKDRSLVQAFYHETTLLSYVLHHLDAALVDSEEALSISGILGTIEIELRLIRARIYVSRGLMRFALKETQLGLACSENSTTSKTHAELRQIARECKLALGQAEEVLDECVQEAEMILRGNVKSTISISA